MSSSIVAKRYAVALFRLAKEHELLDQMENELRVVKDIFENNKDLKVVLSSPKFSNDQKKELIKQSFGSVHTYVLNTLMILIDRHREGMIGEVAEEFIQLANDDRGIADADVYTVRPLTDAEKEALSSVFAAKVGKKTLRINNIVDSDILGGVKVRIGNRIFDGTLSGKLNRLKRQLSV